MAAAWKKVLLDTVHQNKDRLCNIAREIWSQPEVSYEEFHAHDLLTTFLAEEGFEVERNYVKPTGFRAVYGSTPKEEGQGEVVERPINICYVCEYDAVRGVGHAAGHNLCSAGSVTAAVGIKECLKQDLLRGKVTVLGTPAEDCGGSKVRMIRAGAFSDVDVAVMLNAHDNDVIFPKHYMLVMVHVTFRGKAAHASAYPWEGKNALDAAVACYNNIALLRQQLKPSSVINGIIKKGGVQPNVIPDETQMEFWLRAPDHTELVLLEQRTTACIVAAAKATGCEVDYNIDDTQYYPVQQNVKLGQLYERHGREMGINFSTDPAVLSAHTGSTDLGNVSQVVPVFSPAFYIGARVAKNSQAFHEAAGTKEACDRMMTAATALALTGAEVLNDPSLLATIRSEYTLTRSAGGQTLLLPRTRLNTL